MIVGEASGDLHASRLMRSLRQYDAKAEFRFFGGDLMKAEGGTLVRHYRDLAYMGFIPVLLHLPTIFKNMSFCKRDIVEWKADVVILVDYPGFNLDIAKFLHKNTSIPVYYYISPKIWAWKEWRVKSIKRDVSEMFSILPFEVAFYERRHHYPIHYVGNPTAEEVRTFKDGYSETKEEFCRRNGLEPSKPIIALLAGSRKQEIKDNLPAMLASVKAVAADYQCVLACAPSIDDSYYRKVIGQGSVLMVHDDTYPLLAHSTAALVTSGTATLETALFDVPQVVCYYVAAGRLANFIFKHCFHTPFISLVNLIGEREIVQELFGGRFSEATIRAELERILCDEAYRQRMLAGYDEVIERLGEPGASQRAAKGMIAALRTR